MSIRCRRLAACAAVVLLAARLAPSTFADDVGPTPIDDAEEARLAARSAGTPGLDGFSGGRTGAGAGGILLLPFLAFYLALTTVAAPFIGMSVGSEDRALFPRELWDGPSGAGTTFYQVSSSFGFPLYVAGYALGLGFGVCRSTPPETAPEGEPECPPPTPEGGKP